MNESIKSDCDFSTICICAVRYSLGRQTYMPELVSQFVMRFVNSIERNALYVMMLDIKDAEERGMLRMHCDANTWKGLYKVLEREYNKRE